MSCDIINEKNGKIYFEAGYEINEELIAFLNENRITQIAKYKNVKSKNRKIENGKIET